PQDSACRRLAQFRARGWRFAQRYGTRTHALPPSRAPVATKIAAINNRKKPMAPDRHRPVFSVVELFVVILIIGGLIGLPLAIQKIRVTAAQMECANHLRQLGLALYQYHDTHQALPPGVSYRDDKDSYPFMSWNARLLPYLGHESLWQQTKEAYALDRQFEHNPPHVGLVRAIPVF